MADTPLATKVVNALIVGAQTASIIQPIAEAGAAMASGTGGLWVGGTAALYPDRLEFRPNALNRALHAGDVSAVVPLRTVTAVHDRWGFLSGIIEIESAVARSFKIRCFGSKTFSARIRAQIPL